jgi:UDP-glucose 4-epimerase
MKNMEYILVTGGAGYIGSIVTSNLIKSGYKVIVIDDLRDGKKLAVHPDALFFKFNFGDLYELQSIFKKFTISNVLHLAALANVPDSVINPLNYYDNNLSNTLTLLNVMNEFGVRNIIFSSTAAVYGEPRYNPINEAHPTNPINPYGWSKLFVEQIIQDYAKAYSFKYIIFRYFCAAGATVENGESRSYETHLIPVILDTILGKREQINVFGTKFNTDDGTGVRDYIHVEDIANAHILALDKINKSPNHIINLGSNASYSVLQVIKSVEETLNMHVNYILDAPRPGDPAVLSTTNKKAFEILGWKANNALNDIILTAYNWRKNPLY